MASQSCILACAVDMQQDCSPSCLKICLMRPPLAFAKCSGTVPRLLFLPPYWILRAPTPTFCLR